MFIRKGGGRMVGNSSQLPHLGGGSRGGHQYRPQPPPGYGGYAPPPSLGPPAAPLPLTSPTRSDPAQAGRLDALEQRLQAMENNSRSMLGQLTQIQQESQVGVRRDAHAASEQRESRGRLEMALRASQQQLGHVDQRMTRTTAALKETENALKSLSVHTKNIQSNALAHGSDSGGMAEERLSELRQELVGLIQYQDSARKTSGLLKGDLQDMRMKVETVSGDLQALSQSAHLQQEMMEEDTRRTMRGDDRRGGAITTTAPLEGRVIRLQQTLKDVESRMGHENKRHDLMQLQQNEKIHELLSSLGDCKRLGDSDVLELQRRPGDSDPYLQRMQATVDGLRQQLDRHGRDRAGSGSDSDDLVPQLKNLEVMLQQEVTDRCSRETALKTEVENSLHQMKSYSDDGLQSIRNIAQAKHSETRSSFKKTNNALNQLESNLEENNRTAEEQLDRQRDGRRKLARELGDQVDDIGDRLRIGMASLQGARVDSGTGQIQPAALSIEEIERLQNMNSEGAREQLAKALAETESKLSAISTRVEQQDEVIENKLRQAGRTEDAGTYVMGDEISQKIDSVTFSQERLKRQISMLDDNVKECPTDLSAIREELESAESKLTQKLDEEAVNRRRDMDDLRQNREDQNSRDTSQLQQDVDDTQSTVTKLSEAIQVVNRTVGGKVKDNRTERQRNLAELKRDVDRLNDQTRDIKYRIKHSKDYAN